MTDALGEVTTEAPNDVIDVPIGPYDTVADWLLAMGMQQYLNLLISNGFDDIDFLVSSYFCLLFNDLLVHCYFYDY